MELSVKVENFVIKATYFGGAFGRETKRWDIVDYVTVTQMYCIHLMGTCHVRDADIFTMMRLMK